MMRAAIVYVHERRVGELRRVSDLEDYVFRFDRAWAEDPDRPVLGQIFEDRVPDSIATSGLCCWFAHLLPQGPARRLMQRWAQLDEDDDDDFELLISRGRDLPGAVRLEPAVAELNGWCYARPPDKPVAGPGFALAGGQAKLSIREGERGLVVPARGEHGSYIAKLDDPQFPGLPRLEWATTQWARAAGIRAHVVRLAAIEEFADLPEGLHTGDGLVLVAERFDRSQDGPIHAEDFGQILDEPPGGGVGHNGRGRGQYRHSYEDLAGVLRWLSPEDLRQYIERLVFMIICGNGDAHLKNWGVVYPDRRRPKLGPAYDLVATVVKIPRDGLALELAGSRDFGSVTGRSFHSLAARAGLSTGEVERWARAARDRALDAWLKDCRHWELTADERRRLEAHLARVPLCRE